MQDVTSCFSGVVCTSLVGESRAGISKTSLLPKEHVGRHFVTGTSWVQLRKSIFGLEVVYWSFISHKMAL